MTGSIDGKIVFDETNATATGSRPTRMDALATLPVFLKLSGKRAIVAGGGEAALWKAELLAAAGAFVDVYAAEFSTGFDALAAAPPSGRVALHARPWQRRDLDHASIAIGSITSDAEATSFVASARAAGVPVNVIDRPEFCDFQFGAIVNRSPLIVAVSTDGAAPVFGQTIRSLIEGLIPQGFKRWAEAAKTWRRDSERIGTTMTVRRHFWERFTDLAFREADRPPTPADLESLLAQSDRSAASPSATIIGVQSEGAENLRLAAVRALRTADVVIYNQEVPLAVLDFARREAHRFPVCTAPADGQVAEGFVRATLSALAKDNRVVCVAGAQGVDALARVMSENGVYATLIAS